MATDSGNPSELAGLLLVNPDKGNEGGSPAGGNDAPDKTGAQADVDWNEDDERDNAAPEGDEPNEGEEPEGDEATDADEPTDDDGSAEAEGEGEELTEEDQPLHDVTIDGETRKVSLKELRAGYQRQEDYTRKTQKVADELAATSSTLRELQTHRNSYKQLLDTLAERVGDGSKEPTAEQWEQLKASNPDQYAVEWADYQRRAEQRQALNAERQRVTEEQAQEVRTLLKAHVDTERAKLFDAMPHWKGKDGKVDATKADSEVKEIREYAMKSLGYTEAEVNQAYDHRMILLARKAMLYDRAEAARTTAKQKLQGAPELPAPGSRPTLKSGKTKAKENAQRKFDKTGRVADAVDLILA